MRPLVEEAATTSGATAALAAALVGRGNARGWLDAPEHSSGASTLAHLPTLRCVLDAAVGCCAPAAADAEGSVTLLRVASWVVGISPLDFRAEVALTNHTVEHFGALTGAASASEGVCVGALQLVQAICMRRVGNCPFMPLASVLELYRTGRTGAIRAAAEGALVWLSRHPQTNGWLMELPQVRAEPIVLRCRSLHGACRIGRRGFDEGVGWAMQPHELRTTCEEETRLCISDGT